MIIYINNDGITARKFENDALGYLKWTYINFFFKSYAKKIRTEDNEKQDVFRTCCWIKNEKNGRGLIDFLMKLNSYLNETCRWACSKMRRTMIDYAFSNIKSELQTNELKWFDVMHRRLFIYCLEQSYFSWVVTEMNLLRHAWNIPKTFHEYVRIRLMHAVGDF